MERASKRHSIQMAEQDVDRLSALPDSIICHILSFMPTKLSVKTSILAKRWRFLWAHVPILDLQVGGNGSSQTTSFGGIICALMLLHKVVSLSTFRLRYRDYDDDGKILRGCYQCNELQTCIATAIERNVQNLDLFLPIELPLCVLTCKTLVNLWMGDGVSIPSGGPIYLPTLKKLYFNPPEYDVHVSRLVSGCPVIEELIILIDVLIIDESQCLELEDCTISSPTLKRFTFSIFMDAPEDELGLKINAPALRYLNVRGVTELQLSVSVMNLIEADIFLSPNDCRSWNFLDSICNVKCLKLSDNYDCDAPTMPGSFVKFYSLTKLELSANWFFLKKFLESADNLQELIIDEGDEFSKYWMDPVEEGCACLLHSLRTVRIDNFDCTEEGVNMVRFILRNARVLQRMEIYCPTYYTLDLQKQLGALQRISSSRRGSKECEFLFS